MENQTKTEKKIIIPIDKEIGDFKKHLDANNRTILSAKFGDGKSYFLDRIKNNEEINREYKFLTIYPVNYQVVKNEDIFEILKRDIIFQLLLHDIIKPGYKMPDIDLLSWYLYNKGTSIAGSLLPYLAEVGLEPEDYSKVIMAIKGITAFKKFNKKFKDFITKEAVSDDDLLERLILKVDNKLIYECDPITKIIKTAISEYKKENHKKIALIIEDMDRMDPAHMFRILNILSAHIDYCYKSFVKPDSTLIGNKFDLDNIIVVIDYANLKNIYGHFYGENTDFNGYISKFLSSTPFHYSFEKIRFSYYLNEIQRITSLPKEIIDSIFTEKFIQHHAIREVINSFDIGKQISPRPKVEIEGEIIYLNDALLKVIAIMRRLKVENNQIVENILNSYRQNADYIIPYLCPFMFLDYESNPSSTRCLIINRDYDYIYKELGLDKNSGKVIIFSGMRKSANRNATNIQNIVYNMMTFIVK